MKEYDLGRRTWLEINLDKMIKNIEVIRRNMKDETAFCAILKANGVGHGSSIVAKVLDEIDTVDMFGVACPEEAYELRAAGVQKPILIIGYSDPAAAAYLEAYDIAQCCYSLEYAKKLDAAFAGTDKKLKVHIKIDTGLSRLGIFAQRECDFDAAMSEILEILTLPHLEFEGIFTHFANAYEIDRSFTDQQYTRFMKIVNALEEKGITFQYVHCNNSPGGSYHPDKQCTMARSCTTLSGYPMDPARPILGLEPVVEWKTKVVQIKKLPVGATVSYGCTYKVEKPMKIAVLSVGYADGLFKNLQGKMSVLINGKRAKSIGSMCMDFLIVDITDIENVEEDQTATIFGNDHGVFLDPGEISWPMNLHPMLMLLYINRRVSRCYFKDGKQIAEINYLTDGNSKVTGVL